MFRGTVNIISSSNYHELKKGKTYVIHSYELYNIKALADDTINQ